jgi:hypothetical protein
MAIILKTDCSPDASCPNTADGSLDIWLTYTFIDGQIPRAYAVSTQEGYGYVYRYSRGPTVSLSLGQEGSTPIDTHDFSCTDNDITLPCTCGDAVSVYEPVQITIPAGLVGACCALPVFFTLSGPCTNNYVTATFSSESTLGPGVKVYGHFVAFGQHTLNLCV